MIFKAFLMQSQTPSFPPRYLFVPSPYWIAPPGKQSWLQACL